MAARSARVSKLLLLLLLGVGIVLTLLRKVRRAPRAVYHYFSQARRARAFVARLVADGERYRAWTRFTVQEVEQLCVELYGRRGSRLSDTPFPKQRRNNRFVEMTLYLLHISHYEAFRNEEFVLGYSHGKLNELFHQTTYDIVERLYSSSVRPLTPSEQVAFLMRPYTDEFHSCGYIVDGIYFPVDAGGIRYSTPFYSAFYGYTAWLAVILIDTSGIIRACECLQPRGASETVGLTRIVPRLHLHPGMKLMADRYYRHHTQLCMTPYSLEELRAATQFNRVLMKESNRLLSVKRVLIEHVFGVMKQDWGILQHSWVYDVNAFPQFLKAACILTNKLTKLRRRWTDDNAENNPLTHAIDADAAYGSE